MEARRVMSEFNDMAGKMLRAFAPASTGNVSLGFDLLGAALKPIDGTVPVSYTHLTLPTNREV